MNIKIDKKVKKYLDKLRQSNKSEDKKLLAEIFKV